MGGLVTLELAIFVLVGTYLGRYLGTHGNGFQGLRQIVIDGKNDWWDYVLSRRMPTMDNLPANVSFYHRPKTNNNNLDLGSAQATILHYHTFYTFKYIQPSLI